jgi:hypothetical protein
MDRDTGLIRTDQIGRLRFTADQRRVLLDAFESSGQSASVSGKSATPAVVRRTVAGWVTTGMPTRPFSKRRALPKPRVAIREARGW